MDTEQDWDDLLGTELRELLTQMRAAGVAEMEMEQGQTRLRIRRGNPVPGAASDAVEVVDEQVLTQPSSTLDQLSIAPQLTQGRQPLTLPPAPFLPRAEQPEWPANQHVIRAPLVGTFYRSPAPDKAAYIQEGAQLQPGQVVGVIEAMKMYNEIQSDVAGTLLHFLVENAQPVEYGQPLMVIELST